MSKVCQKKQFKIKLGSDLNSPKRLANFYDIFTQLTIKMKNEYLKNDPEFAEKLTQLLDSHNDASIQLAYQLMQGGGIPQGLVKRVSDDIQGKILCLQYHLTDILTHLQILQIHDTILQKLPPSIGHLDRLMILELINNQLVQLPSEIGQLSQLSDLQIVANNLTSLPEEMAQLQNLEKLNAYGNQLTEFPEALLELNNLESLNLGGNQISSLPQSLPKMQNLKNLDIGTNPLHEVAQVLVQMPQLEMISLSGLKLSQQEWKMLKIKLPFTHIIR